MALTEEFLGKRQKTWTGLNLGMGAVYAGVAAHDLGVTEKQKP